MRWRSITGRAGALLALAALAGCGSASSPSANVPAHPGTTTTTGTPGTAQQSTTAATSGATSTEGQQQTPTTGQTQTAAGEAQTEATAATTTTGAATSGAASSGSAGTRTAPAPAFTETESSSGPLSQSGAEALLASKGYKPIETLAYRTEAALSAMIGENVSNSNQKLAFFFSQGRFLGTDASEPSRQVGVVGRSGKEITLAYGLFDPEEEANGIVTVTFALVNGKLKAREPIPPESERE